MGILKCRELTERNRPTVRERNLHRAQCRQRHALLVSCPHDDIHQVDIVADLRYGDVPEITVLRTPAIVCELRPSRRA